MVTANKNVVFETCDVTKWKDLQQMVDASVKHFGDVPDVYIASAGVFEPVSRRSFQRGNRRIYKLPHSYSPSRFALDYSQLREQAYSNFWDDPEGLDTDGYKAVDINVNHPVSCVDVLF